MGSSREIAPAGWKLVPIEPTEAMLKVGLYHGQRNIPLVDQYKAMLAAAPTPPGGEGWQSIETAPRDGAEYLLVSARGCGCEVVRWAFGDDGTWVDQVGITQGNWPTHWRPLPAPPTEERP